MATDRDVEKRLEAIRLVEAGTSVKEACRRTGIDRQSFYKYRRRFQQSGVDGLRNQSRAHNGYRRTPERVVREILRAARAQPRLSNRGIASRLSGGGVSPVTVQDILNRHGLGKVRDRMESAEKLLLEGKENFSADRIKSLEEFNPNLREKHCRPGRPGELLVQDTFKLMEWAGSGSVYLSAIVDPYSSYTHASINGPDPKWVSPAGLALITRTFWFYGEKNLSIGAVKVGAGGELYSPINDAAVLKRYERALLKKLVVSLESHTGGAVNGFTERFFRIVRKEFLGGASRIHQNWDDEFLSLKGRFAAWLEEYNAAGTFHHGYPNYGRPPVEIIDSYLRSLTC